jgi:hypothetical protein
MKIIGIIGSRRRNSSEALKKVEEKFWEIYEEEDWIVSGGCPKGGDRFAEVIAKREGIPILIFYPNYKKYNRGAPTVRNTPVAQKADVMIACVAQDRKGGTEDTIKKYLRFCEVNNKEKELWLV